MNEALFSGGKDAYGKGQLSGNYIETPVKLSPQTPRKSLNKAYLKEKVGRADIDLFKKNLITLFDRLQHVNILIMSPNE